MLHVTVLFLTFGGVILVVIQYETNTESASSYISTSSLH